jgi:hypothetical protein
VMIGRFTFVGKGCDGSRLNDWRWYPALDGSHGPKIVVEDHERCFDSTATAY